MFINDCKVSQTTPVISDTLQIKHMTDCGGVMLKYKISVFDNYEFII